MLRKIGEKPTVCHCPPDKCSAPKPEWCIGRRATPASQVSASGAAAPQAVEAVLQVEPTPAAQQGEQQQAADPYGY